MPRNHLNERMEHSENGKSLKSRSSHMANNDGTTPVYIVLFSHQKKSLNNEL